MAKDDYDVIVYKILLYFYAVMKRKIQYERETFEKVISKSGISDEYLVDILRMMQDEGLIEGVKVMKAWGNDSILISEFSDISITADGIHHLKDNTTMKKIGKALSEAPGLIASLIAIAQPFI